jgi:hypothetical protein
MKFDGRELFFSYVNSYLDQMVLTTGKYENLAFQYINHEIFIESKNIPKKSCS